MTKAETVYTQVNTLVETEGLSKAEAFERLAAEYEQPTGSLRGLYYTHSKKQGGGKNRTRRRETTPADALADARAALERALVAIDEEVAQAAERASEAKREHDALKGSAQAKKEEIGKRLEALA